MYARLKFIPSAKSRPSASPAWSGPLGMDSVMLLI